MCTCVLCTTYLLCFFHSSILSGIYQQRIYVSVGIKVLASSKYCVTMLMEHFSWIIFARYSLFNHFHSHQHIFIAKSIRQFLLICEEKSVNSWWKQTADHLTQDLCKCESVRDNLTSDARNDHALDVLMPCFEYMFLPTILKLCAANCMWMMHFYVQILWYWCGQSLCILSINSCNMMRKI